MKQQSATLDDTAILELTKKGERELREPGTALGLAQLEALILVDGFSTVDQVVRRAKGVAPTALRARLAELVAMGLINVLNRDADDILDPGDFFTLKATAADTAEAGEQTRAEAEANTEFLRRNGYCVNMARRPAVKRELAAGRKPMVLVIDDDPDICKLLQMFLKMENIDTRTAANREEIVAEFRKPLLPDMMGTEVCRLLKGSEATAGIPVIMLTAEATREAVLKGILGGADGYITKPFEIHPLIRAVKTVLGLKYNSTGQDWDYSL